MKSHLKTAIRRPLSEVLAVREGDAAGIAGLRIMTPDGRRLFATQAVKTASGAAKVYLAESRRDDAEEVGILPADRLTLLAAWPEGRGAGQMIEARPISTTGDAP